MSLNQLVRDLISDLETDDMASFSVDNAKYGEEWRKKYSFGRSREVLTVFGASLLRREVPLGIPSDRISILDIRPAVVTKDMAGITGLFYIENYLSATEMDLITEKLSTDIKFEGIYGKKSRRVAQYGYYYSYDRSGLKVAPPIPNYLAALVSVDRINNLIENLITTNFDQLIINEYYPNQKIAYHTDHPSQFGPIIACLTVGQCVPINFMCDDQVTTIDVKPGSMYIMTGAARYQYKHSLKNNTNSTRYSLTYRTINKLD
jgi:alkylated DNA repair dioxygenase AlkB